MSIQIVNPGSPGAKDELLDRLNSILSAHAAALLEGQLPDGVTTDHKPRFRSEVKALVFALTGTQPTDDDLSRAGA